MAGFLAGWLAHYRSRGQEIGGVGVYEKDQSVVHTKRVPCGHVSTPLIEILYQQSTITERVWDSTWDNAGCTHPPTTRNQPHRQPALLGTDPQATSSTGNLSYKQPIHRQPVLQATEPQATSPTGNRFTGYKSYRQPSHRQQVLQVTEPQATGPTSNRAISNQSYRQPSHRQPVLQAAEPQATSPTGS